MRELKTTCLNITDHYHVEILLECKFVNFIKTLAKSNNKSVSYMGNYMSSDCRSTYGHNIRHLYLKYDITYQECLEMSMNQIKRNYILHGFKLLMMIILIQL